MNRPTWLIYIYTYTYKSNRFFKLRFLLIFTLLSHDIRPKMIRSHSIPSFTYLVFKPTKPTSRRTNRRGKKKKKKKKERKAEGKRKIVFRMGGAKHCPAAMCHRQRVPKRGWSEISREQLTSADGYKSGATLSRRPIRKRCALECTHQSEVNAVAGRAHAQSRG